MGVINKRILVISDIHGCLNEFKVLLDKANYDPIKDQLILLGDYVDRGRDSKGVVEFVKELVDTNSAIALRGNHDQMFCDWLSDSTGTIERYYKNGGLATIQSFLGVASEDGMKVENYQKLAKMIVEANKDLIDFLAELPLYYEMDSYVFVHAGINPSHDDWKKTSDHEFIWIREPFLHFDHSFEQTIIHGHTPTYILQNDPNIFYGNKKIGIDGACVYGHQLNCLEIIDGRFEHYFVKKEGENVYQL